MPSELAAQTNDEARMTDDEGMSNDLMTKVAQRGSRHSDFVGHAVASVKAEHSFGLRHSDFVVLWSFVIRHSSFARHDNPRDRNFL